MTTTTRKYIVRIDGPTSAPRFWVVTAEDSRRALVLVAMAKVSPTATDLSGFHIVGEVEREVGPA